MIRISVAMCTWNGSQFLEEQLESIRNQTLLPSEMIVCDDGSTDDTLEIITAFAQKAPFPVRILCNPFKLGSTRNFEKAISLSSGDAIALCDQDDSWHPNKLQRMAEVLESDPELGGVFTDALLMDEKSRPIAGSLWQRSEFSPRLQADLNSERGAFLLLERRVVTGATLLFRSSFVAQITPIPSVWVHDAWIALLVASLSRLRALPEPWMTYRLHARQQVGLKPRHWYTGLQIERTTAMEAHDLEVNRWRSMAAKLATLPVDPQLTRLAQKRLNFLQGRTALRQRSAVHRVIAATRVLPQYFRFSNGLFSYGRDVTGG